MVAVGKKQKKKLWGTEVLQSVGTCGLQRIIACRSLCNVNTGGRGLMTILNSKLMECFQEGSEELRIVTGVATKAIGGNGNVIFMGSNAVE